MSERRHDDGTDPSIALPDDQITQELALDVPKAPPVPRELPRGSQPPPAPTIARGSRLPPGRLPSPSDAPPPRSRPPERAASPPERQRLAQMQTQLDQARSTLARQTNELDELRARLEAKEARLDEMLEEIKKTGGLDERLRQLDARGDALAEELRARIEQSANVERLDQMDARVRELEDGPDISRIRMRLERVGHTMRETLAHFVTLEETQRELVFKVATQEKHGERIERLESLFAELADELRQRRDVDDLERLRARLDDFEAIVVAAGEGEKTLREVVKAQSRTLDQLRDSLAPPALRTAGDDLTKVKGIGPKFAKQLQAMGITTYAAIAEWTDHDVAKIANELGIKPTRITNANWVASAKALAAL